MEAMRIEHQNDNSLCPAYGQICKLCKGKHHFENCCMKKRNPRNVRTLCYKCGWKDKRFEHENDPNSCPSYGKICDFCKGLHHNERFCMIKKKARDELNLSYLDVSDTTTFDGNIL